MADRKERSSRLGLWLAIGASLIGGLSAMPAMAQPRRDFHRPPPPRYDRHRDWGRPGYYGGPAVVVGPAPVYVPPPVVYAPPPPPLGLNLMFNIR